MTLMFVCFLISLMFVKQRLIDSSACRIMRLKVQIGFPELEEVGRAVAVARDLRSTNEIR